jgi:hypothetical protein
MPPPNIDEYARQLSRLEGNEFQEEFCARLQSVDLSAVTVPAKPSGDAGLDAISDGGRQAYCCYGPEHSAFKNDTQRAKDIVRKFRRDLARLLEVEVKGRGSARKIVCCENEELKTIVPDGIHIAHIHLVCNFHESHQVIGPLFFALNEFVVASRRQYVSDNVTMRILGPNQIASIYGADEMALNRIANRQFYEKVKATAATITIGDVTLTTSFETKMEVLKEITAAPQHTHSRMAEGLRRSWAVALAFEKELDETVPKFHRRYPHVREEIEAGVSELVVSSSHPWAEIPQFVIHARDVLVLDFGQEYPALLPEVGRGEIARLIGECTVDWPRSDISGRRPGPTEDVS